MSNQNLRLAAEKLLKIAMKADSEMAAKNRKALERVPGQVFAWDIDEVEETINKIFQAMGIDDKINTGEKKEIDNAIREYFTARWASNKKRLPARRVTRVEGFVSWLNTTNPLKEISKIFTS